MGWIGGLAEGEEGRSCGGVEERRGVQTEERCRDGDKD